MKLSKILSSLVVFTLVSGCAVGNKYSYHNVNIALPVNGSGEIGLAIVDGREDILSGKRDPDFVGVQRAMLGNPWAVATRSGNPFTDDVAESLEIALMKSGYDVTALKGVSGDAEQLNTAIADSGKDKNVVLTVNDWKTDIYMNMTLFFDLLLNVVNGDGDVIASTQTRGEEKLSGAAMTAASNARTAASALETKVSRMFNDPEIRKALE